MPTEDSGTSAAQCSPCERWGPVEALGPVPPVLEELSGLAASLTSPDVLYAHNDSGDSARFFALNLHAEVLAEVHLTGADAVDWEDIATGPCIEGSGSCVFLGDVGDNHLDRSSYTVYEVQEPDLRDAGMLQVSFERLPFVYPQGAHHNAETLLVHPRDGDLYVITKEETGTRSEVFKFPRPFTPGEQVTLSDLGPLPLPADGDSALTAGDVHPCGHSLLLRMYNRAVELRLPQGADFDEIFSASPMTVPTASDEPQGEAIVWGRDGQSYFTASEQTGQKLHRVRCAP
jgi:hypothetical protein